jgi:hypothetical protein
MGGLRRVVPCGLITDTVSDSSRHVPRWRDEVIAIERDDAQNHDDCDLLLLHQLLLAELPRALTPAERPRTLWMSGRGHEYEKGIAN